LKEGADFSLTERYRKPSLKNWLEVVIPLKQPACALKQPACRSWLRQARWPVTPALLVGVKTRLLTVPRMGDTLPTTNLQLCGAPTHRRPDAYWAIEQRAQTGEAQRGARLYGIEMPRNSPTGFICAFFATLMRSGAGIELSWKTGSANAMLHASERALTLMIVFATSVAAIVGSTQWLPGKRIARSPKLLGIAAFPLYHLHYQVGVDLPRLAATAGEPRRGLATTFVVRFPAHRNTASHREAIVVVDSLRRVKAE
jgi:hypothetical protein